MAETGDYAAYQQNILRLLADAFREFGSWRLTHVEPNGLSHVESVSAGQLATIAFDALAAEGLVLTPQSASSKVVPDADV